MAWTEFGGVGEGRRAVVTQIDRKRHTPSHPGLDPAGEMAASAVATLHADYRALRFFFYSSFSYLYAWPTTVAAHEPHAPMSSVLKPYM